MDTAQHNSVMGEITELKVSMATLTTNFAHLVDAVKGMQDSLDKLTPRNDSNALEKRIAHLEAQVSSLTAMVQRGKGMWLAINAMWAIAFGAFEIWRSFK